ncbi:adenylyl-sulfate kinase [Burkholderia thailandensis]|uniref:adenylyl-sulfate kinase n=1 Tax=Burkholderia thailandensis TaxID=57975 RepID=UPI002D799A47|nr:adenylyl-sulfate kinase [Burkholderia thailandensis]WRS70007.1 adenylyl-sulfate kinase [Burkholderia thailandensis]
MQQEPRIVAPVIWLTGRSGAGKSTIASGVCIRLIASGVPAVILDGDQVRSGLSEDLGFDEMGRSENIRRIAHVARILSAQSVVVIVAVLSPLEGHRALARSVIGRAYFEVFVDAPLPVCEMRDVKGLYARARRGEIGQFTGISSPYEPPVNPDLVISTAGCAPVVSIENLLQSLPPVTGGNIIAD